MKISQILDKIDEHQLFVPAFQREYVWRQEDAKDLMASLIKEYPTGTMLTWDTNNPPELKGNHIYDPKQGAVKLILDGQQRITTLYMIIRGELPPYYTLEEITHDTRNLYVNLETLELSYFSRSRMEKNPLWVNLTDIFKRNVRCRDIIRQLEERDPVSRAREDLLDDNFRSVERILDREFVEQSIPIKATIKEAIDIFYIVNASGVNLTEAELALAQISGYWPNARERFKTKLLQMEKTGFVFGLDFLVYVLLGVLHNSGSEMKKLHTVDNLEPLKAAWTQLETHTLDYVMRLMRTHAFIDHTKEINSVYALVPIIVYVYRKGNQPLSQEEINKIIKWFYYAQIRNRYISQMPQKLDKDNGIAARSETPFDDLLNIIRAERPLEINKDEFVGIDVRNPLFSLMRWYFKSRHAICPNTGMGLRSTMGKQYEQHWDHIFPFAVLKENGYGRSNRLKYALAMEITNRTLLAEPATRGVDEKSAEAYLSRIQAQYPTALRLQSIPQGPTLWKLENFEDFLEARRILLAEDLNNFLNNITATPDTQVETSIEELIEAGESSSLEFKASLCWSYDNPDQKNKSADIIMKAISAFSNGEGGTLLIGVNDEGQSLGLEHDYARLPKRNGPGDKDQFELHLRELLRRDFGDVFAATNVDITFPVVEGKEICRIDVKRGTVPYYLTVKDKNSQKQQKFYVRSGNSSPEIGFTEIGNYIKMRFP